MSKKYIVYIEEDKNGGESGGGGPPGGGGGGDGGSGGGGGGGGGAITVPPLAAAAGFNKLIFSDEFDGPLDIGFGGRQNPGNPAGHKKWSAGLFWYDAHPPEHYKVENSILTLTADDDKTAGNGVDHVDLATQWQDHQGGTQFLGGYFEARIWSTNWSSFWLFCWNRPRVWGDLVRPNDPMTWTNEIDILETDPGHPNSMWTTLHKNTSGDSLPDEMNQPSRMDTNIKVIEDWHNYGILWTRDRLTWVVDGIPINRVNPFQSTWQPTQLILSAAPDGVGGSKSTRKPSITRVDWVRVWHT